MTRSEYRKNRRLIRDNGRYALRWLTKDHQAAMDFLLSIQNSKDRLAERADIISYCAREGVHCTPRHTA